MRTADSSLEQPGFSRDHIRSNVLTPDQTLPVQFDDIWHHSRSIPPERMLALSVLWQAAMDLQKCKFTRHRQKMRLYREAYKWVASNDRTWPYSFVNLCEVLSLSPEGIRAKLLFDELRTTGPVVEAA